MRLTPEWICIESAYIQGYTVYVTWCVCYCCNWEPRKPSLCRKRARALCNVNEVGSEWHFQHNVSQLDVGKMYALLQSTCHVPRIPNREQEEVMKKKSKNLEGKKCKYKGKIGWKQQHSGRKFQRKWPLNSFVGELQWLPMLCIRVPYFGENFMDALLAA